jgi:hypothetical protein
MSIFILGEHKSANRCILPGIIPPFLVPASSMCSVVGLETRWALLNEVMFTISIQYVGEGGRFQVFDRREAKLKLRFRSCRLGGRNSGGTQI